MFLKETREKSCHGCIASGWLVEFVPTKAVQLVTSQFQFSIYGNHLPVQLRAGFVAFRVMLLAIDLDHDLRLSR